MVVGLKNCEIKEGDTEGADDAGAELGVVVLVGAEVDGVELKNPPVDGVDRSDEVEDAEGVELPPLNQPGIVLVKKSLIPPPISPSPKSKDIFYLPIPSSLSIFAKLDPEP